ncbi:hypothetical protein [Lederbergia panacisoli]|uniref:hypothetical protein n=1 Tax=Lederbergia panacisoli TaxID=1255251 RepID=UPI00214B8D3F|nr:hypothetical protein [Lederbergia panacisoli]MCR2822760.1 hypothetical protein [Lederbergia panacisoli]
MNYPLLRKLSVFSIIGGILQIIATFGFGYQYQMGHDTMGVAVIVGLINALGMILILIGMIAVFLYSYQIKASLNLFISFIVLFIGSMLEVGGMWTVTFVSPMLKVHAAELASTWPTPSGEGLMISLLLLFIGWVYFGISLATVKVLPVIPAVLVAASLFLDFAPLGFISYFGGIFWAIGIIGLSTAVYKRTKTEVVQGKDATLANS